MRSYDYSHRKGVLEISWEEFGRLSRRLAEELANRGTELVIGIARAGLFPATAVACALRCELYPVRVTRRVHDRVTFANPVWRVDVPSEVAGQQVVVVDEIADTGETLALVAARCRSLGAAGVTTAVLVGHTWARPAPDVVSISSNALVLFPWDQHVLHNGRWELHPELSGSVRGKA